MTLVVPALSGGTIAVRIPAHPVALRLLQECGLALAAPSANRSESISPTTAEHVLRSLPEVPMVLDGGPAAFGIESTVLDLTSAVPRLLRPGALGLRALREAVGRVELPGEETADGAARPSPGMSKRHYAPRATLILSADVTAEDRSGLRRPVKIMTYAGEGDEVLPADPQGYAADLYAALHRLDDAGAGTILVQQPPQTEEWLAVRDRLSRAAA